MTGCLITLEGGEGAGKSSALAVCREQLERHGIEVVSTREPGGPPLAERIRALLLDPAAADLCPEAELLLMFAARAQHVRETIRPALARGAWVLSDRYTDSSFAYQGAGRGLPESMISTLEAFTVGDTRPDLTLLLDLPVVQGMARTGGRGGPDRIEAEHQRFFERIRDAFRTLAGDEPERFRVIDASQSMTQVAEQLRAVLDAFVGRRKEVADGN